LQYKCCKVTKVGGAIGIPGLYVTEDPGASDESAKIGSLSLRLGLGWAKSLSFATGQCPGTLYNICSTDNFAVMKYHRKLMNCILYDRIDIAKAVNATGQLDWS
jgi:glutathione-independent formaldehyde dehydrogenase